MAEHEERNQLSAAKLALLAKWSRGKGAGGAVARIAKREGAGPAPLSYTQERVWLMEQLTPGTAAYHIADGIRLTGRLDTVALQRALAEVVRRHEALRTVFPVREGGEPLQAAVPEMTVDLPVIAVADEEALRCQAEAEAGRTFDLQQGPLFRFTLLRIAPDEHVLLIVLHHLIADGWSTGILVREMQALYTAYVTGQPAALTDLPLQYADWAVWQRGQVEGGALGAQLTWWKERLAEPRAVLELPADYARPAAQSYRGAICRRTLPAGLVAQFRTVGQREAASLFMLLLAGYKALLHRYSGQVDMLVGTPTANRARVESEGLIGFFSETTVLRTDLSGDPTFGELLVRVKATTLDALAHQELPFEKLLQELQPERSLSHSPLFQAGFSLLNAPVPWTGLPGLTAAGYRIDPGSTKFDLWLVVHEGEEGGLELALEYSTDLFAPATVERLLGHYEQLLAGGVAEPGTRLSQLPLLTEAEWQQIVVDWNRTPMDLPEPALIHRLIEAQARRAPDREALVCGAERLTYGELNRRANRLARHLRRLGVGPEVLVGLCTERSAAMVVGLLAVLKAGGGYVPVDPAYPADRIAYMLQDSNAKVVLTDRVTLAGLPKLAAEAVLLDEPVPADGPGLTGGALAEEADTDLDGGATPDSLAYVLYTSGSTGKPKGVQVTQRNVVNLLCSMAREPGATAADVLVAVTSISFDIAGLELYLPLVVGARLVVAPRDVAVDGVRLARLMAAEGATLLQATPVTWRLLEEAGWQNDGTVKMLIGGEALPRDLAARLSRTGELWNMYGPTETTIWSAIWQVPAGCEGALSIGRPIANTQVYVLDEYRNPVPVGVPGELYIGGAGVARGYFNRPDLTNERFVVTRFGRTYRTGDLVRFRPDGNLEFLGRLDHQIKLNGYRIEIGEIEAALTNHPGVKQAAVMAREDAPGEKLLVGYIVPAAAGDQAPTADDQAPTADDQAPTADDQAPTAGDPGPATAGDQAPSTGDLQAHLRLTLPDYMVPSVFVVLDKFPLTPNGKVDRKALPKPEGIAAKPVRQYVAPRTETEKAVAEAWAEVLKLDQAGLHDNFFEAGGHSLMGIRLLSRLRDTLGVELPLRVLFEASTVEALAAAVDNSRGVVSTGPKDALPEVAPDPVHRYEPFGQTYVQQAYLTGRSGYFDLGACGTNFYSEFEATEAGAAFLDRFNQAMRRLIERHDSLRTVLLPGGAQRVLAPDEVPAFACGVVDLRGEPEAAAEQVLAETRGRMKLAKADVYAWPLFEFRAHLLDGERIRFQGRIDALILDGTSNMVFMRELFQLLENPAVALEGFALGFRDYARGLEAVQQLDLWSRSKAYWEQRVQELPPAPRLPLAVPITPLTESHLSGRADVVLQADEWERFKARAAAARLTPSAAVLAALTEVMGAWSRTERFTLSLVASYRFPMHPDIHRMVGNFNSISLLGVDRATGGPFRERARQVQAQISLDLEHMYYPGLLALQDWNQLTGAGARAASPILANSLLEYSHSAYAERQLDRGGCTTDVGTFSVVDGHFTIPQILIEPIFWVEPDGTFASQWYALDDAFPPGVAQAMWEAQACLLKRLANAPEAWEAAHLDLLPEAQWEERAESDLLVLDGALADRPDWVPGPVYRVASEGLVIHPRTGRRLAPTGQTGRHLPDGRVELLGPGESAWAVINGYEVELPQVERALQAVPGVADAAVVERDGRLIAHVVPTASGTGPSGADLRRALRAQLPGYMVPSAFIHTRQLPLGPGGLVDRAALPGQAPDSPLAPADHLEQALLDLWGEVLEEAPVSPDDNFYLLGGTSLTFLRLVDLVERRFGRRLPVTVLCDGATVAHMAAALREAGAQ